MIHERPWLPWANSPSLGLAHFRVLVGAPTQRETRHQRVLRLVLLADDADHLVEVEEDDDHAGDEFEPPLDRRQPMPRERRCNTVAAMVEPLLQGLD